MKHCIKCGKQLSNSAVFCGVCGHQVQTLTVTEVAEETTPADINDTNVVTVKKKGKKKFVLVGLLVVALAAWLIYPSLKFNGAVFSAREIAAFEKEGFIADEYGSLLAYTGDETDVVVPDGVEYIHSWNGFPSTDEINDSLTSVILPGSVTNIGSFAFENCDALTEIVIPGSVTNIGSFAFENCDALTEIVIPDSVIEFGNFVFASCDSLKNVYILNPDLEIEEHIFSDYNTLYCHMDFIMYGYTDSTAESFASDYNLVFVPVDGYDLDDILSGELA